MEYTFFGFGSMASSNLKTSYRFPYHYSFFLHQALCFLRFFQNNILSTFYYPLPSKIPRGSSVSLPKTNSYPNLQICSFCCLASLLLIYPLKSLNWPFLTDVFGACKSFDRLHLQQSQHPHFTLFFQDCSVVLATCYEQGQEAIYFLLEIDSSLETYSGFFPRLPPYRIGPNFYSIEHSSL